MLAVLSRRDVVTAMLGSAAYIWLSRKHLPFMNPIVLRVI